ncbi:CHAT domain-containing protein [Micromonospora sp. NPDC023888]|uniref:CHAT domain-containing protein n=1 Tax=Micromonospora sp. NPDC023888 TaxID=3155607 RepID=UPI0033CBE360
MTTVDSTNSVPLDGWVAHLIALIADPPPDADLAELTGMLGQAYLEWYEAEPDEGLLAAAIAHLDRAIDGAPHHDQAVIWHAGLGVAHAERARLGAGSTDHDQAIDHLTAAYQGWPADDPERDLVAVDLLEATWDRFLGRCLDDGRPTQAAAVDADEVVAAIEAIRVSSTATDLAAYVQMVRGMALLARYDCGGEREQDLEHGIDVLSAALAQLPPDITPGYATASADLAAAHLDMAGLREDPRSVELAATVADRGIEASGPGQPGWLSLHRCRATACEVLWDLGEDPGSLDKAIGSWRTVAEDDADPTVVVTLAGVLRSGAEHAGDPSGLAEAVTLLKQALPLTGHRAPVWRQLAETHRLNWQLTRSQASLDAAARYVEHALAAADTDDDVLAAHTTRLVLATEVLEYDAAEKTAAAQTSLDHLAAALDEANQVLDNGVSATTRARVNLATALVYADFARFGEAEDTLDLPRLRHLITLGRALGADAPPRLAGLLDMAEGLVEQAANASSAIPDSNTAVEALLRAGRDESFSKVSGDRIPALLSFALQTRASQLGDLRGSRAAGNLTTDEVADGRPQDPFVAEWRVWAAVMVAFQRARQGDVVGLRRATAHAGALARRVGFSHEADQLHRTTMRVLDDLVTVATGRGEVRPHSPVPLPARRLTHRELGVTVLVGATQVAAALRRADLPLLRRWADHLATLAHQLEPGHTARFVSLTVAAQAELAAASRLGDRTAAARAVPHFEAATAESGGPANALWTDLTRDHAEALRRAGDPDRARTRRLGLAALHGHARRVLLQAGTDHAMDIAREATADATTVVRWCLQDQADDDLITALDAGRGLVLHAATASRTIADSLREAGHPALAEEWRQTAGLGRDQATGDPLGALLAAGEVPDDLRPRVLRALEDAGTSAQALAQVRVAEIRAALTELDLDALVYLVPAARPVPGFAAIVPATGKIEVVELPDLVVGDGSPMQKLLQAALGPAVTGRGADTRKSRPRDAGPVGAPVLPSVGARMDDLCRWAWRAAMARIVAETRSMRSSASPRLVLIPMGALGLVPWHAAYQNTPSGRRYAVHDLVLSYSPSARMLCTAAARPPRPIQSTLVVGDPLGDLPFAGIEARAIHKRFHQEGQYLGGPEEGPDRIGHPDSVLAWIRAVGGRGASLLHLACHGRVDPVRPADSHLVLAGGQLPARQLLEVSRLAALELGHVFLAACTTNLVGADYDEAFSLATAFVAAGAHTVFGSLWSVPDVGTSLLMYLVHQFLYEEGHQPTDALHRAQLWMLDPARQPPDGMPAELAAQCGRADNAAPVSWAAFTHLGR